MKTLCVVLCMVCGAAAARPKASASWEEALAAGQFKVALGRLDKAVGQGGESEAVAQLQLKRAVCWSALGRLDAAEAAVKQALEADPRSSFAAGDDSPGLTALLQRVKEKHPGTLTVETALKSERADLTLDGEPFGPLPAKLAVVAGVHQLEVVAPDGRRAQREVVVRLDEVASLALELPELPRREVEAPEAEVLVPPPPPPPPAHVLAATQRQTSTPRPAIALSLLAASVAVGGASAAGLFWSHGVHDRYAASQQSAELPGVTRSQAQTASTVNTASWVGVGVSAALLAAGVTVWATRSGDDSRELALAVLPQGVSVTARW